jgi:hypothetical protein
MTDESVVAATELLVRDRGREAAEADLQERITTAPPESPELRRAQAALAALRKGEVQQRARTGDL